MKRIILLLITIISLNFIGCGSGGSSKEAKELLQKILQVVGIPHEIVINICQDGNENGICEDFELQTKVTINRGDTLSDIWQKISLTEDGKYFLETRDITKPILLELQDSANVTYDNGKFTIPFSGFKTHENNETKELSILASMVDKNYFSDSELYSIRHLNSKDTQEKFYAKLLKALEDNINTLRGVGLNSQDAMSANLKEMANQLIADGIRDTLPEDLNRCGADGVCVDRRLDTLYTHIIISNEKAESIKSERDSSATSTPTTHNNKKGPLVSKKVEVEKSSDGETETTTTTYEYNSKNQIIKDITTTISTYGDRETDNSEETCNYNYDSNNRFIGEVCKEISKSPYGEDVEENEVINIIYKDNRLYKVLDYNNSGELSESLEVLEWSGNKPMKWKFIDYDTETGKEEISIFSVTYTGDNPTHIEGSDKDESWSRDRKFDNKLNPYYYSRQQQDLYYWFGLFGKNNIIEETWSENTNYTYIIKNSITYNSSNMPTRIDTTETSTYNGKTYTTTSYTTYEYIEPK